MIPVSNIGKNPAVSIIIPVYNRKKLLTRAVESVLSQTFQNFELLIIDDGSTDDSYRNIFKLIDYDYRIKYLRHFNRKTPLSLNAGINLSSGKFITFLDSDDEYSLNHIEQRVKLFSKNKDLELIYSGAMLIGSEEDMYVPDARNPKKLIHLDKCVIGATLFGKEYVFRQLGGFRNVYSYDSDFVRRAKRKFSVGKFDSATYIYRRDSKDSVLTQLKKSIK